MEYQNKHYDTDQKDEGTQDDRRRDGWTNSTLRIKEQGTHLTLHEHDDDDDDDDAGKHRNSPEITRFIETVRFPKQQLLC